MKFADFLTYPFTTFKLWDPSHDVSEQYKMCRTPDLEAGELWKGRSGVTSALSSFCIRWCGRADLKWETKVKSLVAAFIKKKVIPASEREECLKSCGKQNKTKSLFSLFPKAKLRMIVCLYTAAYCDPSFSGQLAIVYQCLVWWTLDWEAVCCGHYPLKKCLAESE